MRNWNDGNNALLTCRKLSHAVQVAMTAPVQTEMRSQDATAGNCASGAQEEGQSQKIAMTAPVQTTMQDSAGDSATGAYKCTPVLAL